MDVGEVIAVVDSMKPNTVEEYQKKKWIEELEKQVEKEVFANYDMELEEKDYTENSTRLYIPDPYDTAYRWYVESYIDLANGEIEKYNNSRALFNNRYNSYENWFIRNNESRQPKLRW